MRYRCIGGNNFDIDCILEASEEFRELQDKEDKIKAVEIKLHSIKGATTTPVSIRFLIAHYLGITTALAIDNNTKALLLQYLLNTESIDTVKKYLSWEDVFGTFKSSELFTIADLEAVHSIFEEAGLTRQCMKIHDDILAINNYELRQLSNAVMIAVNE